MQHPCLGDLPPANIVERIACEMIRLNAEGGATQERLLEAGFTGTELAEHMDKARAVANGMFVRKLDGDGPAYDRPARIAYAADILGAVIPDDQEAFALLRRHGYTARECGDLWPDIVTRLSPKLQAYRQVA